MKLMNYLKKYKLLLNIKYLLVFGFLTIYSCTGNIKECPRKLEFAINGQRVPSSCDFFGVPKEGDSEILAELNYNEDLTIDFINNINKHNPKLKIWLGKSLLPPRESLTYTLPHKTGIVSLKVCINKDCLIKYIQLSAKNPKKGNRKNYRKKKEIVYTKTTSSSNGASISNSLTDNNSYYNNNNSNSSRSDNAVNVNYKSSEETSSYYSEDLGEPESTSNYQQEVVPEDKPIVDNNTGNATNMNYDNKHNTPDKNYDSFNNDNRVSEQDDMNDTIEIVRPIEPEYKGKDKVENDFENNDIYTEEKAPEQSNTSISRKGRTGISFSSKCKDIDYVKSGSISIIPKNSIMLVSLYVFANDIGKLELSLTGDDGLDETIVTDINPGKTQILLSELYPYLSSGVKYKLFAKVVNVRDNIDTKIENAKACSKTSFSDENINIKYLDNICFFNIEYEKT